MKIKINRNVLLAMHTLTSRDESRHVINGVSIEVGKRGDCFIIATDGRRLAAIKCGEVIEAPEHKTSVIMKINPAMLRALPKSDVISGDVVITFSEKSAAIQPFGKNRNVKFESELIEGSFPKWRQVIPKGNIALPIKPTFNWKLLEGFSKAADMISGKRDTGITVRQADESACMLILLQSIPEFVGALMPMRGDCVKESAPDWATEEEESPKATEPTATIAAA